VTVSNPYGTASSAPAQLTVVVPATILVGPANLVAINGVTVLFNVVAQGTAPLAYQWLFNATNQLSGATNSSLTLTSVTIADAGNYSVLVTNGFGSALSSPASLR